LGGTGAVVAQRAKMNKKDIVKVAKRQLSNENSVHKCAALKVLHKMLGKRAVKFAFKALRDNDSLVRRAAISMLTGYLGEKAVRYAIKMARSKSEDHREVAIELAKEIGGYDALRLIHRLCLDDSPYIRRRALGALLAATRDGYDVCPRCHRVTDDVEFREGYGSLCSRCYKKEEGDAQECEKS